VVESLYHVGAVLEKQGRFSDAASYFGDALAVNCAVHGPNSSQVVSNLRSLVQLYDQAGLPGDVERCLIQLLRVLAHRGQAADTGCVSALGGPVAAAAEEDGGGANCRRGRPVLLALARICYAFQRFEQALEHATRAMEIEAHVHGRVCVEVGRDLCMMSKILFARAGRMGALDKDRALVGSDASGEGQGRPTRDMTGAGRCWPRPSAGACRARTCSRSWPRPRCAGARW
jgi:tetratricopeptide (TPR) repeat protein